MSTATNTRVSSSTKFKALEIKVPAELAQFAKKFDPVVLQIDETPVPPNNSNYFADMDITNNVELDNGDKCILDTQFDFRFILNYIMYHIIALYPDMNVKGHPFVTPVSLVGYCLTLVYAHILATDYYYRKPASYAATRFMSDPAMKDLFRLLLNSSVPPFLADLLLELAPVSDPRRPGLRFVPTLNGYSHLHDFGRTFLPAIFYNAHDILASTRTNMDPVDVLNKLYARQVIMYGTQTFTVSSYFGRIFENIVYTNSFVEDFEMFVNPLIGRSLSARPTYARMLLKTEVIALNSSNNIYVAALLASTSNSSLATKIYEGLSKFVSADMTAAPKLGSVLSSLSGSLLLSHSLEPPTIPTWTGLAYDGKTKSDIFDEQKSPSDLAAKYDYLTGEEKTGASNVNVPASGFVTHLYLVKKAEHDPSETPYKHIKFDDQTHVTPDVLYFQPYDVSASAIGLTIAAGLKIESSEFDGFMVPVPNFDDSLFLTNSQFLNSAVRLDQIFAAFSSPTVASSYGLSLLYRAPSPPTNMLMAAIISMSKAVLPFFDNKKSNVEIASDFTSNVGITPEDHHYHESSAFNVKAGLDGKFNGVNVPRFYGWSSYRYVHTNRVPTPAQISFIMTFRTVYGTNVTLSRSRHPTLIIPHN